MISKLVLVSFIFFTSCGSTELDLLDSVQPRSLVEIDSKLAEKFETKEIKVEPQKEADTELKIQKPKLKVSRKANTPLKSEMKNESANESVDPWEGIKLNTKAYSEIDKNSYLLWKKFNPSFLKAKDKMIMDVKYMGVVAAQIIMQQKDKVMINGREAYHFQARAKTAEFYKWVYAVDDVVETFIDSTYFVPLKYSMTQVESNKVIDHVEIYDRDNLKTYFRYKRNKKGKISQKSLDHEIPFFSQDLFSAINFMRGLPLTLDASYNIPMVSKAKNWFFKTKVLGTEVLDTPMGDISAIKLVGETEYAGDLAKQGKITYWISNDQYRVLLQFESDMKIGSIMGKIKDYTYNDNHVF